MILKRCALVMMALLCVAPGGTAFAAQIEGFNYANDAAAQADWIVSGNDTGMGGSGTVYASLAEKKEGISAVKFVYNYSGNPTYEMRMTKTLGAPIDLSQTNKFTMWLYGDSAANTKLLWYIRFYSSNGYVWRYVNSAGLGTTGWNAVTFDPVDMTTDRWVYGVSGSHTDNPAINEITKIELILQQKSGVGGPGTATVYFDDLQEYPTNDYLGMSVVDNLNYATDVELEAEWAITVPSSPPGFALDISETSTRKEGSGAMKMDYTIVDRWLNITCANTLPTVTDYSDVAFFKLWVYGDGAIAAMHPVMLFTLEDESQNRIWAHMRACLKASAWSCYFLELTPGPSDGSAGPFWQDQWDAGGDCDITKIQKVGLFTQGSVTPESYSFTCIVDNIVQGFRTTGPTPTPFPPGYTAVGSGWLLYE